MQARKSNFFKEWATTIVILILQHCFSCFSAKPVTGLRRGKFAEEEDTVGLVVPDEEQEGMIAVKSFITGH